MTCKDCRSFLICYDADEKRVLEEEPCKYFDRIFVSRNKKAERALKDRRGE